MPDDPGHDTVGRRHGHSSNHPDWIDRDKMAKGELGIVHEHDGFPKHLHKRPGDMARYKVGTALHPGIAGQSISIQVHDEPRPPQIIPVVVPCPRCGYRPA